MMIIGGFIRFDGTASSLFPRCFLIQQLRYSSSSGIIHPERVTMEVVVVVVNAAATAAKLQPLKPPELFKFTTYKSVHIILGIHQHKCSKLLAEIIRRFVANECWLPPYLRENYLHIG